MNETNCKRLERDLIEATVNYELATKQAAGMKIKGDFYTIVFDERAQVNLEDMTKKYQTALKEWVENCIKHS